MEKLQEALGAAVWHALQMEDMSLARFLVEAADAYDRVAFMSFKDEQTAYQIERDIKNA